MRKLHARTQRTEAASESATQPETRRALDQGSAAIRRRNYATNLLGKETHTEKTPAPGAFST